ncbi:MAG TPA: glucose-6-phosphate isomerase, partial [Jatrophihabitans sp.]
SSSGSDKPVLTEGAIEVYPLGFDLGDVSSVAEALNAFFATAPELGYLSIQAYLDRHADASAADLRGPLAARTQLQTTFGWGPRFLHSTGQYHKGGHQNGIFLQITGAVAKDLSIPDRPYTFSVLQSAQAAGDAAVLVARGRPVLHLHLTDRAAGIGQLLENL